MRRLRRALVSAVLAVVAVVGVPLAAAAQQPAPGAALAVVHDVDATGPAVRLSVLSDAVDVAPDRVALWEDGSPVSPDAVDRATELGRRAEAVFVVDTSERLATGGAFDRMKDALATEIAALPEGTRVAVVAAGELAQVRHELTTDRAAAAAAVRDLPMGPSAALWDAVDRAAELFSDQPDRFRTVVAVSSSTDSSHHASAATARAELIRAGGQAVTVGYRGGAPGLAGLARQVGGAAYAVDADDQLGAVLGKAADLAGDRVVVTYPSAAAAGDLVRVALDVDGAATELSFTAGAHVDRITALAPVAVDPDTGFAVPLVDHVFEGRTGLFVVLGLALVGVTLAVWALASLVGGSDEDLDRRLARYSLGPVDEEGDDGALGQTALFRRAVAVTESVARQRGVLAKAEALLEKGNLPLRPAEALFLYAVVVVLAAALSLVLTRSLLGVVLLTGLAAVGPLAFVSFKVKRRQRKFETQLPDALQLLAGTLRAGYSLPQGMEAVSHEIEDPMGFELRRVMTEARLGRELEDALEAAAQRLDSPDFAWAVMAIGIQREVGGNLNELLMTVSDTMVARERLRGEVKTLTAEGRMSAIILGGLPPALGLVMWVLNPGYINTLFSETLGQALIGLAVLSATVGLFWMKKVITIDV